MRHLAFCAAATIERAVSARSFSHSDLPTPLPSANRNVLAMPPPMMRTSTLFTRLSSRSSLVDTLAPPTIAATGRFGLPSASVQRLELLLHRPSGMAGRRCAQAFSRRMRAMGGGESVIDIDVAELGEFVDMGRIVLLLALVEAGVLQQKHVAVLHLGDRVAGDVADAVGRQRRPAA